MAGKIKQEAHLNKSKKKQRMKKKERKKERN